MFQNSDILLYLQTRAAQNENMPNFALVDPPPVKIRGGVGEISIPIVEASPTTEPLNI